MASAAACRDLLLRLFRAHRFGEVSRFPADKAICFVGREIGRASHAPGPVDVVLVATLTHILEPHRRRVHFQRGPGSRKNFRRQAECEQSGIDMGFIFDSFFRAAVLIWFSRISR